MLFFERTVQGKDIIPRNKENQFFHKRYEYILPQLNQT